MTEISVLSPQIANMIAAGEVVERPASVIKELIENSIDAGAKAVTVEIRDGGITYMRVSDNGRGMNEEDAKTCFLRHATSKIHEEDDLAGICTLGFRGEALAAIASVSHVELFTKQAKAQFGTHIVMEAGEILECEETGCPDGTTIIVKDLFFNTPARMKFLKKDNTEASYIEAAVEHIAIGHADIKIQLLRDGKAGISSPGDGNMRSAIYASYGANLEQSLLPLTGTQRDIEVAGFTTAPGFSRSNRAMQNFFVNGRYIQSKLLTAVMDQAYSGRLMHGKFAACFIKIRISPSLVDVNVHPTKLEVKFAREKEVFSAVYQFVSSALDGASQHEEYAAAPAAPATPRMFTFAETTTTAQVAQEKMRTMYQTKFQDSSNYQSTPQQSTSYPAYGIKLGAYQTKFDGADTKELAPQYAGECTRELAPKIDDVSARNAEPCGVATHALDACQIDAHAPNIAQEQPLQFRLIGEVFSTYILIERDSEFLMIDKHAGHERILYNKLKDTTDGAAVQALLAPESIIVTRAEKVALLDNIEEIERAGFEIDDFGGNAILVRGTPMYVKSDSLTEITTDIAQKLMDLRASRTDALEVVLKSVACKAAVKAGYFTDEKEMHAFAAKVLGDPSVRNCPHGRPVIVHLTKTDIEKMFKRIV